MITTYRTRCWGDLHEVAADWAQASCAVFGCDGKQVADFQHYPERAMRWALVQEARSGGFNPEDPEDDDDRLCMSEITEALSNMREVEVDEEDVRQIGY